MNNRVVILPFDGHPSSAALLAALNKTLDSPDMAELIAYIKINDGAHNPDAGGPATVLAASLILAERKLPIGIFLDLKIYDVSATLENTLKKYLASPPDILTVCSNCSVEGIIKLRKLLPQTKLAMISMLTDIGADECASRFGQNPDVKIYNDLINTRKIYQQKISTIEGWDKPEPFDLVVCSPHELQFLKRNLPDHYGFIVPGIRDEWMKKKDEHQKRVTGVRQALDMGATYVVMGAQMTKGNPEADISPTQSRMMTRLEIFAAKKRFIVPGSPLETLKLCGGYYKSPQDEGGNFLGPLVAYAGDYYDNPGFKNYVGFEYFNFARAEAEPTVRRHFANLIADEIKRVGLSCTAVIGAPMGSILIAGDISNYLQCRTIFAEKKVVALANPEKREKEKSELIIDRHEINAGDNIIIAEDVCNNFSTTQKLKDLIESKGGKLIAIVCAFNRSGKTEWEGLPVLSALFIPTEQFKQDNPMVAKLIEQENIVWKPKVEWERLMGAMRAQKVVSLE